MRDPQRDLGEPQELQSSEKSWREEVGDEEILRPRKTKGNHRPHQHLGPANPNCCQSVNRGVPVWRKSSTWSWSSRKELWPKQQGQWRAGGHTPGTQTRAQQPAESSPTTCRNSFRWVPESDANVCPAAPAGWSFSKLFKLANSFLNLTRPRPAVMFCYWGCRQRGQELYKNTLNLLEQSSVRPFKNARLLQALYL